MKVLLLCSVCVVLVGCCWVVIHFSVTICVLVLLCSLASLIVSLVGFLRFSGRCVTSGTIGFFHPHAEDGGGGERVLWSSIRALQRAYPKFRIVLFTRNGFTPEELTARARRNFNLTVDAAIEVVELKRVALLNPDNYPRFTLICQAMASFCVAWEGLSILVPEIFVETSGWAFCCPMAWCLGSKTACYVHYPTISADMLKRVRTRNALYNNSAFIANSHLLSVMKFLYYRAFAAVYAMAGMFADVVIVNSSWTWNHIKTVWYRDAAIVFPPVDTDALQELSLERSSEPYLISVGQFRPEKNQVLQIKAYAKALEMAQMKGTASGLLSSKLKIVGSCRNEQDQKRLQSLKELVIESGMDQCIEFFENIPFHQLKQLLGGAIAGLHTMMDEHFGIGIVEYMAAGVLPIAHNSGGPKLDILAPSNPSSEHREQIGFLRTTIDEYADAITIVMEMNDQERRQMAVYCREKAQLFNQDRFERGFLNSMKNILGSG